MKSQPSKSSLRTLRLAPPSKPFATVKRTAEINVQRFHLTLGLLDSFVAYRTISASATILIVIQTIFTIAKFSKNSADGETASISMFVAANRATIITLASVAVGYIYFRISHAFSLLLDRNVERRGPAPPSGRAESQNHRHFSSWADGEPDFSDIAVEIQTLESAQVLALVAQAGSQNELFTLDELGHECLPSTLQTKYIRPFTPQFQMNVVRTPLATSRALKERLTEPSINKLNADSQPIVDSLSKQAVWCVADAGGAMVAKRERELADEDMEVRRKSVLQQRKQAVLHISPDTFHVRLQKAVVGVSSHGTEIVNGADLSEDDLRILGLL